MTASRYLLLLAALLLLGVTGAGIAAERPYARATKAEKQLRGTWYSATGIISFKDNGTVKYQGKRYFYAVSNGGIIQLSGERSENAIPYQLSGETLNLIENGKVAVYTRKRHGK